MNIMSYGLDDHHRDEFLSDEFLNAGVPMAPMVPQIPGAGKIIGDGPKFLDAMGMDLSLDDVVLDLDDDVYN